MPLLRLLRLVLAGLIAALLVGCASAPRPGATPASDRDGAPTKPPSDLARVPDAEPTLEPIRAGGPNKPYEVLGRSYVPITADAPFAERGLASWYGVKFHGRRTASGEVYDMYAMTAAHPTLPIPSYARIRNPGNGREVIVRINDRGPFHPGRIVDLSYTAALKLDVLRGVAPVDLQRITFDAIRTGAWRRDGGAAASATAAAPLPAASVAVVVPADSVEPVADAPQARVPATPARGFWVQLGAFRQRDGAESFRKQAGAEAEWLAPLLAVFDDAAVFRLQAGPYPSRDAARAAAERVRAALQLVPVIVERR